MKRTTGILVLAALLSTLWNCGGDSSSGSDTGGDQTPPPSPSQLRVDKIRDGEVWLSWAEVIDEESEEVGYLVYRAEGEDGAVAVDSTFRTIFQDQGLRYEEEYTYYVTAVDAAGNESGPSNSVSGQPFNNLAPLAPTGLRAFAHNLALLAQGAIDVSLDWNANVETDLVGYRVYRATDEGFAIGEDLLLAEVEVPRFVDEEVEVGTLYFYKVTAVDKGGKESPISNEVSDVALPPAELVEPVQGALTSPEPTFSWRPVPGASTYQVIVTTSPTSGEISAVPLTSDTSAVFVGRTVSGRDTASLESGQLYYWKLISSTRENGQENSVSRVESFKIR